jgi:hypothetical protein
LIPQVYHLKNYKKESSGFILLLVKQSGTQHVKPSLILLVLVDESGLLPLLSGVQNL